MYISQLGESKLILNQVVVTQCLYFIHACIAMGRRKLMLRRKWSQPGMTQYQMGKRRGFSRSDEVITSFENPDNALSCSLKSITCEDGFV